MDRDRKFFVTVLVIGVLGYLGYLWLKAPPRSTSPFPNTEVGHCAASCVAAGRTMDRFEEHLLVPKCVCGGALARDGGP